MPVISISYDALIEVLMLPDGTIIQAVSDDELSESVQITLQHPALQERAADEILCPVYKTERVYVRKFVGWDWNAEGVEEANRPAGIASEEESI